MSIELHLVNTPYDVVLNDKDRLGPTISTQPGGPNYQAIYGFSCKESYEQFIANSDLALTPYPLVKGYLRNQIAEPGETVRLVVIDASGPQQTKLIAATMNSVLEAHNQKANQVTAPFSLMLDQESQAYRVEKASPESELQSIPAEV